MKNNYSAIIPVIQNLKENKKKTKLLSLILYVFLASLIIFFWWSSFFHCVFKRKQPSSCVFLLDWNACLILRNWTHIWLVQGLIKAHLLFCAVLLLVGRVPKSMGNLVIQKVWSWWFLSFCNDDTKRLHVHGVPGCGIRYAFGLFYPFL